MSRSTKWGRLSLTVLCALLSIVFTPTGRAQLLSQGQETTTIYQGTTAYPATNTPALNFSLTSGLNTFLMSVNPAVSARVSITNETVNACLGTFTLSMAVAAQGNVGSFNSSLQSWQSVALIGTTGQLVTSIPVDIPASGTVYITSTAISAQKVALQIVNSLGTCSNTNIDVTVTFIPVSVTSPLISVGVNGAYGGTTANVQGVIPQGLNGGVVFPVVDGAVQPAVNASTVLFGVDNFSAGFQPYATGAGVLSLTLAPPAPSFANEWALAFATNTGGGTVNSIGGPWTCIEAGCVSQTVPNPLQLTLQQGGSNNLTYQITNPGTTAQEQVIFVLFNKKATIRQHQNGNQTATIVVAGNTLAGSTGVLSITCSSVTCNGSPTDTQGNAFTLVKTQNNINGANTQSMSVWLFGPTTAAADTITFNLSGSSANGSGFQELTGTTPAQLNQPLSPLLADTNKLLVDGGNLPGITDPCQTRGALKSSVPINISAAGTTQLVAAVLGQTVYPCSFVLDTTGATTTTTALFEYGTGASCGSGTTAVTGLIGASLSTSAIVTSESPGSTLFKVPASNAFCVLVAGTTPSVQGHLTYVQQ